MPSKSSPYSRRHPNAHRRTTCGEGIARIYEAMPLLCPMCGGQIQLIAFVTDETQIRKILENVGVDSESPHISPACGPSLWDGCDDAQIRARVSRSSRAGIWQHIGPDYEVDQSINLRPTEMAIQTRCGKGCVYASSYARLPPMTLPFNGCDRSAFSNRRCLCATTPCHTWLHAGKCLDSLSVKLFLSDVHSSRVMTTVRFLTECHAGSPVYGIGGPRVDC